MRTSRLLSILMQLQLRGRVAAEQLARYHEVSVRTIYRDVDALSAAGVPVYAERGRLGGIALHAGYRTRLTGMTRGEARTVPFAGLPTAANDLGMGVDAAAAQLKLLASLPADDSADAQRVAERIHFDPVPWYHRAETISILPTLAAAVLHDLRARIVYESWDGNRTHDIGPLGLVQKGGLWYLIAAVSGRPRTFRASSIRRLDVLDARVQRPRNFNLAAYWPRSVAQFEARLMRSTAQVLITEEGMRILRAVSPAAAERAQATQRPSTRNGWVQADLPIESPAYSARQLLRLGTEVEVIAPRDVRDAVAKEAAAVARRYRPRS